MLKGTPMNIVYTDIAKAFDSVSHKKLVYVLRSYGINTHICSWISNFLSNRSQSVCIGTVTSFPLPVISGVPQGSVVGPLLFLIYFNDITCSVDAVPGTRNIKLFADDAKLYDTDPSYLQLSLDKFVQWLNSRQLNIASHKYINFRFQK